MRRLALSLTVLAAATGAALAAGPAGAAGPTSPTGPYAPLNRPGPALTVSAAQVAAATTCSGNPATGPTPVLLVPGTTQDPATNFSWNYEKGFTAQGRAWCAVDVPDDGMADIQTAGEYVVSAVRTLHARAGRRIDVVGYSQGGMSPRWALRFWPDTRAMVDDDVAIDPSNHGTLDANALCALTCAPSIWQQQVGSHLLTALNSGAETFAGVSYSVIWSDTDEIVVPNAGPEALSALHTGAGRISNTPVQSICPLDVSEHLAMGTYDPVGYALVVDALDHAGPASAARVPASVCTEVASPPVDLTTLPTNMVKVGALAGYEVATYPHTPSEPALAPYVYR